MYAKFAPGASKDGYIHTKKYKYIANTDTDTMRKTIICEKLVRRVGVRKDGHIHRVHE